MEAGIFHGMKHYAARNVRMENVHRSSAGFRASNFDRSPLWLIVLAS